MPPKDQNPLAYNGGELACTRRFLPIKSEGRGQGRMQDCFKGGARSKKKNRARKRARNFCHAHFNYRIFLITSPGIHSFRRTGMGRLLLESGY